MPRNHSKNHPQLIRDAKVVSSNPVASTKNTVQPHCYTVFFCLHRRVKAKSRITVGSCDEHPKMSLYFFPHLVGARKLCPWAETRRLDQKNAGNCSNFLHFLFVFSIFLSLFTAQQNLRKENKKYGYTMFTHK